MPCLDDWCKSISTRVPEAHYTHSRYVAEWWNTLSNLPFVAIGLARLYAGTPLVLLYTLFTAAGVCSAFHHARPDHWTLVVDWVPIALSAVVCTWNGVVWAASSATLFKVALAFAVLVCDNTFAWPMPVPWGHVMWHVLAAYSIDSVYCDYVSSVTV